MVTIPPFEADAYIRLAEEDLLAIPETGQPQTAQELRAMASIHAQLAIARGIQELEKTFFDWASQYRGH